MTVITRWPPCRSGVPDLAAAVTAPSSPALRRECPYVLTRLPGSSLVVTPSRMVRGRHGNVGRALHLCDAAVGMHPTRGLPVLPGLYCR